jgi:transposase InsO family protein
MLLADFLSRYHPKPGDTIQMDQTIHAIRWSDSKIEKLQLETRDDRTLSTLSKIIKDGWPEKCCELPKEIRPFWTIKDYLSIDNGVILKGEQIVVPDSMQQDILEQIHSQCHQGIEKTRLLARKCVFWQNINQDIADHVGSCETCNTFQNSQRPEPMYERDLPSAPWQILGTDLFSYRGNQHLLIVDYYSKFLIVRKLKRENSACVIAHMKQIFTEHGIPDKLYSDNGPCYASEEFLEFSKKYSFNHITSSPNYQQSNGLAERFVQTAKGILKKCDRTKTDPELAFLILRTTPIASGIPSPAELLYGRQVRSTLPLTIHKETEHKEALKKRQETQKSYYDSGTRELPELQPGQPVMLQSHKDLTWKPATVVTPSKEPRSYVVQTTDGVRYRRNRRFLRNLPTTTPRTDPVDTQSEQENNIPSGQPEESSTKEKPPSPKKKVTIVTEPQEMPSEPVLRRSTRNTCPPKRLVTEM